MVPPHPHSGSPGCPPVTTILRDAGTSARRGKAAADASQRRRERDTQEIVVRFARPNAAPRIADSTLVVQNGVVKIGRKALRQSVGLPPRLAKPAGSGKDSKLSKNRMLLE